MLKKSFIKYFVIGVLLLNSCTKLHENFLGDLTQAQVGATGTANSAILLQSLYNSLESVFTDHLTVFPLEELCTDEAIAPTRGTDWDDNGVWRALHQQKWLSNNERISGCFNSLGGLVYSATDLLQYSPSTQEQAEARFIRAWAMYLMLDMFDQVPYRDPGESLVQPARVRKGIKALDYIISEIDSIQPNLPDVPVYKANKYAAKFLLMKCYINKAVYENRSATEFNFTPADMNKVISLADSIIKGGFSFSTKYFDNFAPDNGSIGKENIFTLQNIPGSTPNNGLFLAWIIGFHYNQDFGIGTNGWTTLSDFYNKFESIDKRKGIRYDGFPPNPSKQINVGFLIGQQYDYFSGDSLRDRTGAPLIFIKEVSNIDTGSNKEVTGIRAIKYFPDWQNFFSPDNDFVFFRFSDVLLMKAEAIYRGGTGTTAGSYGNTPKSLLNAIRTDSSRGASALSSVSLVDIYDERGRELWWEGWRRQDMIRFKKFLKPFQEKEYDSDPKYLKFPIPDEQIAVNPNLVQNPGYY